VAGFNVPVYEARPATIHADYRPSYNKVDAEDGWKRCATWFDRFVKV
jgi:carboxymethylenebutenolidase